MGQSLSTLDPFNMQQRERVLLFLATLVVGLYVGWLAHHFDPD